MTEQTQAEEAEQEAREARYNAAAWRAREATIEAALLVRSREKPDDEPGDGPHYPVCKLPMQVAPAEHRMLGALWCGYCGEY